DNGQNVSADTLAIGFRYWGQPTLSYVAPSADPSGGLHVDGKLQLGNTAAATTLGSVAAKFPIYDASGTLVGWVPLYTAIT
ncbi:MAG TPA: hypothetical protein VN683_11090, partial [Acidothermaceae bacterium]|nr:hypothetical protein [Acidothermaceae bacterium]